MTDDRIHCSTCAGVGVVNGDWCTCAMAQALRTAPRFCIGDDVYVFPPGTSMEQARSVIEAAQRITEEELA